MHDCTPDSTHRKSRLHFVVPLLMFLGFMTSIRAIPIAHAQIINEEFKILPDDGKVGKKFGYSIDIDDGIITVGAPYDDANGGRSGAAYLFDAITGEQLLKLHPDDAHAGHDFGSSIAIDNGILAVGAWLDSEIDYESGAVYLFDVSTGEQRFKLLASDGERRDHFGEQIAMDDGILVVGVDDDDDFGPSSGSTYLFGATTGEQIAKLMPEDGAEGDDFGEAVAIDDGLVAVGAPGADVHGPDTGLVYLFDAHTGEEIIRLYPVDGIDDDARYGVSVTLGDGVVAVGAVRTDDDGIWSGSAYLFDAATGEQLFKLLARDGREFDYFGADIAIDNGMVVIGATEDDDNGGGSGSAYLFDVATGEQLAKFLPSDGAREDDFGWPIAFDGGVVAVGVNDDDDNGFASGSAYVFDPHDYSICLDLSFDEIWSGRYTTWTVKNATPGRRVALVMGVHDGVTYFRGYDGYCASFEIAGVNKYRLLGQPIADANGEATVMRWVPYGTAGDLVLMQAAQQGTCPDECMSVMLPKIIR